MAVLTAIRAGALRLILFLSADLKVVLKLILRIKLRSADGTLIRLPCFMFFCHVTHLLSIDYLAAVASIDTKTSRTEMPDD